MKNIFTLLTTVSVIASTFAQGNLTVTTGKTLTIEEPFSLTVLGDFTNSAGTVTLNSTEDAFSSIIVEGMATGDVIYNRYVNAYDS